MSKNMYHAENVCLSVDCLGQCHIENCNWARHNEKECWCSKGWGTFGGIPTSECPLFKKYSSHVILEIYIRIGEIKDGE